MSEFYILEPAVNTKETGRKYPPVESYNNYNFKSPNSVHKIKFREFPDFEPDIRFKLAKGAKLCDLMGQATINAHGFLVSPKMKSVFENANIIPHRFYPASIESNGIIHPYFWIHFVWNESAEYIDFEKSDFYAKRFSQNLGKVFIKQESDILLEKEKFDIATLITFNSLVLKPFSYNLCIFNYFPKVYIKSELKSYLEVSKLTGIQLTHTEKLIFAL